MIREKCPHVNKFIANGVKYHGFFNPEGVTIHYTADEDIERSIRVLKDVGLGYHIIIDKDGSATQIAPLTNFVYHAGKSSWNGRSCNSHHLAISLVSWGLLNKEKGRYLNWTGKEIDSSKVKMRRGNITIKTELLPWEICTPEQETKLQLICKWLVDRGIDPKNFCGHDECAIPSGRKADPGGTLSFTMTELRDRLNDYKLFNKDENMA